MSLSPQEAKQLNEALVHAYIRPELSRMLRFELGRRLDLITTGKNFREDVFELIEVAERQGWTDELINAAHDENPGNPRLKAFVDQYVRFTGTAPALERLIDKADSFLDVARWRSKLARIERQVCAIEIDHDHAGTGFLIAHDLVLTNYHVIKSLLGFAPGSKLPVKVRFDFKKTADGQDLNRGVEYVLAQDWLLDKSPYSPSEANEDFDTLPANNQLDYAVLRLAPRTIHDDDGNETLVTAGREPVLGTRDKERGWISFPTKPVTFVADAPLFIMQHPSGLPLKMALKLRSIIGVNANGTRVRHRTNTLKGSSGSGCFDNNWNLIALHHAGDPDWSRPATFNQAVPMDAIRAHWERTGIATQIFGIAEPTAGPPPSTPDAGGASGALSPDDEADSLLQD